MSIKGLLRTIFFVEILEGMSLTLRRLFSKPVTIQYPDEKKPPVPGFRGLHALAKFPSGRLKCVGCGLCAAYCPSKCIHIYTSEGGPNTKIVDRYEIDLSRCIFCGFCVEACPYGAIVMTEKYIYPERDRNKFYYTKDMLLENWDKYFSAEKAEEYYEHFWRPKIRDFSKSGGE
ncbi:MAG: NADH-quinone oxidoreductase subunit NuoI [Nitrospirae bacterium]|nr:MAG: NADH-quinone oxidoreductase subunit NuoI [Nitrospirota bacterium]